MSTVAPIASTLIDSVTVPTSIRKSPVKRPPAMPSLDFYERMAAIACRRNSVPPLCDAMCWRNLTGEPTLTTGADPKEVIVGSLGRMKLDNGELTVKDCPALSYMDVLLAGSDTMPQE